MLPRNIQTTSAGVPLFFSIALYYLSLDSASNLLNFLSVVILLLTGVAILSSRDGWVFLLYVFGLSFAMTSGLLIELTGAYLIEIDQYAELTGAAARNTFLSITFLTTASLFYFLFIRLFPSGLPSLRIAEPTLHRTLLAISFGAPLCYAIVLLVNGSPLIIGMDRFSYMTNVAPPFFRWIHQLIPSLGLVVAMACDKKMLDHKTALSWLLFTIVIYVFGGEKFSGIFTLLFCYFLPTFISSGKRLSLGTFGLLAMLGLIFASIVMLNYYLIYGSIDLFLFRLALQGQMSYAIDSLAAAPSLDANVGSYLGLGSEQNERGIAYLMYQIADATKVDWMLQHNARFTTPFPANFALFIGPPLAPLAVFVAGATAGSTAAFFAAAVRNRNLILSVVALKLFFMSYVAIMMGEIYLFFEWKAIVLYSLTVFYLLALTITRSQHRRPRFSHDRRLVGELS